MNLIDYYKKVLKVLGLYVTEDDFITINPDGNTVWLNNGKSIVLPTKDHINTLFTEDDDGKPVVSKILFNPLDENVIRGDSVSIKKMKDTAELKLSHTVAATGVLLMELAKLKKHKNVPMYIQSFLANLKDVITTSNMVAVDDKSIENWSKLYAAASSQNSLSVKIFLKKSGVDLEGKKHNRLSTMKFPIYDALCEVGSDKSVLGVTLRNKDIKVFKLIYEFLFGQSPLTKVEDYSDDGESPAFIALMKLYVKKAKFPNKVLKALKFLDEEIFDSAYIDIDMTQEDMEIGSIFEKELMGIPTSQTINQTLNAAPKVNPVLTNSTLNQRSYKTETMTPDTYTPVTNQTVNTAEKPADKNASIINNILHGNNGGIATPTLVPTQQQQSVVMPQQYMQQPQQAVPMGLNAMQQAVPIPQQYTQQQAVPMGINAAQQTAPMGQQYMQQPQQTTVPMGINAAQQTYPNGVYQPNQAVYNTNQMFNKTY